MTPARAKKLIAATGGELWFDRGLRLWCIFRDDQPTEYLPPGVWAEFDDVKFCRCFLPKETTK